MRNVTLRAAGEPEHLVVGPTFWVLLLRLENALVFLGRNAALGLLLDLGPSRAGHDGPGQPVQILGMMDQAAQVVVDGGLAGGEHAQQVLGLGVDEQQITDGIKVLTGKGAAASFP